MRNSVVSFLVSLKVSQYFSLKSHYYINNSLNVNVGSRTVPKSQGGQDGLCGPVQSSAVLHRSAVGSRTGGVRVRFRNAELSAILPRGVRSFPAVWSDCCSVVAVLQQEPVAVPKTVQGQIRIASTSIYFRTSEYLKFTVKLSCGRCLP